MIMTKQPPIDDKSSGSPSSRGESREDPTASTQSIVGPLRAPPHSIGYGRPPIHSRFKPGQSGNPEGRPKGNCNEAAELRKFYTGKIAVRVGGKKRRVSRFLALAWSQWEGGMKGNQRAAQLTFANVRDLGLFDEPKMDEGARTDFLSDETLRQVSYETLQ